MVRERWPNPMINRIKGLLAERGFTVERVVFGAP
jgi:hypothetical protein